MCDTTIHSNYTELSFKLTKQLDKNTKHDQGIYFTPQNTIHKNLSLLKPYLNSIQSILEPSCGSGEYIRILNELYPDIHITGIEYNSVIFNSIQPYFKEQSNIKLVHLDFLNYQPSQKYDLIIGNPPYFVLPKKQVDKKYYKYFDGRPNIFILFIIHSLSLLNDNGILSFVLPKNFLNCLYYDKTRKYIDEFFTILEIVECNDNYIETKQETFILILQKKKPNSNKQFTLYMNDYVLFNTPDKITHIQSLYKNSTTLAQLGFETSVGNVVWNQCKSILTDDDTHTRLIYSTDISNNTLSFKKYSNPSKKNYIQKEGYTHPLLILNRGYGIGNYNFQYCLLDGSFEYLIENHLITINYTKPIDKNSLMNLYKKIIVSFNDPRTQEFIELYFTNNAMNTTELNYILPIYIV